MDHALDEPRRLKLVLFTLLQLAEQGGLEASQCGMAMEALEEMLAQDEDAAELGARKVRAIMEGQAWTADDRIIK